MTAGPKSWSSMRLADLRPQFIRVNAKRPNRFREVKTIAQANGVMFLCPECFTANGGPKRTHRIICWSPAVPQTIGPIPGRWNLKGSGLDDLTLVAGSSSVALTDGCLAHFFIRDGEVINA